MMKHLTNIEEFQNGNRIFPILPEEISTSPVSRQLCGNFIEVGFGYQVESMWTEMLFNRSFEKAVPIAKGTYDWFGGSDKGLGNDWTEEEWYHSAYQHNRWYAFPGKDRPESITGDASYLTPHTPGYGITLSQEPGGIHGECCLIINNYDSRAAGVAQDGKFLRAGESYRFSGYFQKLAGESVQLELCLYDTSDLHGEPILRATLPEAAKEGGWLEAVLGPVQHDLWATFALLVSGGSRILCDAFSFMPIHSSHGWRSDAVEALKELHPSVLRFPGGNFGSFHNWMDAVGPKNTRRPEPSINWGDLNYNDVGTDEFLDLCEQVKAEPLLLVNMFHPAKEFYFLAFPDIKEWGGLQRHGYHLTHILDREAGIETARKWVEYCNGSIDTPMGKLRARNGHPEPYHVKYWELDNEPWRWFTKEEYAKYVRKYAQAMRSADPDIQIGICSYHAFNEPVAELLELCGDAVDFIADRMCEPFNIKRKIKILQEYNRTHEHQIYYTDTEALQNRDLALSPFTKKFYEDRGIDFCKSRRTWIYALTMAGNLLHYERYGSLVQFMCFNNLCNTSGQSCIEVSKQESILTASGLLLKWMSQTAAAWPLTIDGYEADSLKSVEMQASWNLDRTELVLNFVNKCDQDTRVTLDFSRLGRSFSRFRTLRLFADDGALQETIRSHGNIKEKICCGSFGPGDLQTFEIPAFSFTETVLSANVTKNKEEKVF